MNFASDNTAPVAPAILDAIAEANRGYARGYGNDDWTQAVERRLSEIFEREVAVFLVPTGTAANALALAQVTPPWGVVFCHAESHIATDECGAPEFFGGGSQTCRLARRRRQDRADTLKAALAGYGGHSPHQMIAVGAVDHAGERSRHHLPDRRDRGAVRDRACARARRAHGWRAFRQCAGAAQRHAGADDLAVRHRRAVVRRHQRRRAGGRGGGYFRSGPCRVSWASGASAPAISCPSIASSPRNFWPIWPRIAGSRWRATPTPWPTGWPQKLTAVGLKPVWPVEANLDLRGAAARARRQAQGRRRDLLCTLEREPGRRNGQCPGAPGHVLRHGRRRYRTLRRPLQNILIAPKRRPNCS